MRFLTTPRDSAIDNSGHIRSLESVRNDLLLRDVERGSVVRRLSGVRAARLSTDGTRLVAIVQGKKKGHDAIVVSSAEGKELGRVDITLPKRRSSIGKRKVLYPVRLGRLHVGLRGKRAWAVADETVFSVSLDGPRLLFKRKLAGYLVEAYSGNGSRVAARKLPKGHGLLGILGSRRSRGTLEIIDLKSGRRLRKLGTKKKPFDFVDVALSYDGSRLFCINQNSLDAIDIAHGSSRQLVRLDTAKTPGFALSLGWTAARLLPAPDDSRLAYTYGARVFVLDLASGRVEELQRSGRPQAFSPDGRLLLSMKARAAIVHGKHYDVPSGHLSPVTALAFLDGGRLLASAGNLLRLWDPRTGTPLGSNAEDRLHLGSGVQLAASHSGKQLAIGTSDVKIVSTAQKKLVRIDSSRRATALAFAPDGTLLAATHKGYSGYARSGKRRRLPGNRTLFHLAADGELLASTAAGNVTALAASPDGEHVAVHSYRYDRGHRTERAELRDVATLQRAVVLPGLERYSAALRFAGADTLVAAGKSNGAVTWDIKARRATRRFALGGCCSAIAVSPDGKLLATAAGTDVQLWELGTRKLRGVFRGHSADVEALAFSPDGRWLASAGRDTSVLVWDTTKAPRPGPLKPEVEISLGAHSLADLTEGRSVEHVAFLSGGVLQSAGETLPKLPRLLSIDRAHGTSCGVTSAHKVLCWGLGSRTLMGLPLKRRASQHGTSLLPVPGVTDAVRVRLGLVYGCALDSRGGATCWGSLGSTIRHQAPAPLAVTGRILDIGLGIHHACALATSGHVLCWGDNSRGQLGTGRSSSTPAAVPGISDAEAIAVGDDHSCALRRTGTVLCWGDNAADQLGNGTGLQADRPGPVRGLANVQSISAAGRATCAVNKKGEVLCWGRLAGYGQSEVHLVAPTAIDTLRKASKVRLVDNRVCIFDSRGTISCGRFSTR
jgi:WD40 repeat protein